ncbi:hypothetical protein [Streptomyces sp. HNM1019]|uniref:hypothetical protein n=1 Tax=Streptomyces sp. HNM1019 TaxID=3424717 RepID=UPI003D782734
MDETPSPWMILMRIVDICELEIRNPQEGSPSSARNGSDGGDPGENPDTLSIIQNIFAGGVNSIMNDQYNVNQAGAVGRESKAEGNTFFQVIQQGSDLRPLASELEFLRSEMRRSAQSPDEDLAVAAIGQAQVGAQEGDAEVTRSHLARAGTWALETASAIGTKIAEAAIRASMGL